MPLGDEYYNSFFYRVDPLPRLTAEFSRLEKRAMSNVREMCQHGWIELAFQARLQRDVRRANAGKIQK